MNKHGTDTISNPHSWNNQASVLYIDQPAGTGGIGLLWDWTLIVPDW